MVCLEPTILVPPMVTSIGGRLSRKEALGKWATEPTETTAKAHNTPPPLDTIGPRQKHRRMLIRPDSGSLEECITSPSPSLHREPAETLTA